VAHAYIVRAVHSPCTIVYQRSERLRCESLACLLIFVTIDLSNRAVCECPVSLLGFESKLDLIYFYAVTFPGVRRAIIRLARIWVLSRQTKARTRSRWPYQLPRRISTRRMRTRYTCYRLSHPKRRKRWIRPPNRRTFIVLSGQSMFAPPYRL
jgi:hypothetical protein